MAGYQNKTPNNPTSDWVWWIAASRKVPRQFSLSGVKPIQKERILGLVGDVDPKLTIRAMQRKDSALRRRTALRHVPKTACHAAPLLARHDNGLMSALGQKRTSGQDQIMSALPPKADIG